MENNKAKLKGSYNFSNINYDILKKIADFKLMKDWSKFDVWFKYDYKISDYENKFLTDQIESHKYNLQFYSERQLQAQFIIPLLGLVNFNTDKFRAWYEYEISGIVNNYELKGRPDFMVASGEREPIKPYFFIQEFKKSFTNSNPLEQLISEMVIAMKINKINIIRGSYNVGKLWSFIILEKTENGKYQYYESKSFDCLDIEHLKQIYINLQAVKHKYCK